MRRKKSAFTLIEVLIALFILATGLIFLFNLFLMGWQSLAYGRKLNEVSLLAQQKFEELKTLPTEAGQTSGRQGDFNWKVTLQPLNLTSGATALLAQLDVEFNFQGRAQKERFVTYL